MSLLSACKGPHSYPSRQITMQASYLEESSLVVSESVVHSCKSCRVRLAHVCEHYFSSLLQIASVFSTVPQLGADTRSASVLKAQL